MKYYQTDIDGFFVGEFTADESPLEPGVYLIPGGAVLDAPPVAGPFQVARFAAGAWSIVPDLRGRVYYKADHSRHVIEKRGESLPVDALEIDPPKTQAEIDAEISEQAKRELVALDLASIRSLREYIAAKADAPQILKDKETAAQLARAKIK